MVILPTKIVETQPPLVEGETYKIVAAEKFDSAEYGTGLRVTFEDKQKKQYGEVLWVKPSVGSKSKLGAFIATMTHNTDSWIGQYVYVESWKPRARKIKTVKSFEATKK